MKKTFFLFIIIPAFVYAQNDANTCENLSKINALIQETHFQPKEINDSLSVYVFDTFLEKLDENNHLFLQPEIAVLNKHRLQIDDYIKQKKCAFLDEMYQAYNKTISRYIAIVQDIKKENFVFSSKEVMKFSKNRFPYNKDEIEEKKNIRNRILFDVLKDISEISKNKDSLKTNFDALSQQSKLKVFDVYECELNDSQKTKSEFDNLFYTTLCSYYDPHTEYFTKTEKATFFSALNSDNFTFGLLLNLTDKQEIEIQSILPGSSAYFSKKIEIGDQIIKIKTEDKDYLIICSAMKKISEIFSSDEYKTAEFTIRKKSGLVYTVQLEKKILKDYSNNIYSYIIEKEGVKTGYIKIPSFYSTFEGGSANVSDDVAKEIYKLQNDKIDGIIIDLQNNGGGSMDEVIKMTGYFINIGPLAILKSRAETEIVKDPNRGALYLGPLVVLINGFSASASEFFANTMQDYNRAIIVGNKSYGKASMQQVFPIDDTGFVKITLAEFYRITGKSSQSDGILPDVEIETLYDKQMPREESNKTALKNDAINVLVKYELFQNSLKNQAVDLAKKSVAESINVKNIANLNVRINKLYDNDLPDVVLNFDAVFEQVSQMNSIWKEATDLSKKEKEININRNSIDIEYQEFDEYLKSNNEDKIKEIKSNLHIFESLKIIKNLIK